jgi:hypothetical protein
MVNSVIFDKRILDLKEEMKEVIPTGLTAGYLQDWTVHEALKEALQNIAYGVVKSSKEAVYGVDAKSGMAFFADQYTGFQKKQLFIGESEQREDSDGLGTFGEGWKIFLLIMAREKVDHCVDTVGFSFWGEMKPTGYGNEALHINIIDTAKEEGTAVYVDLPAKDIVEARESFALLQGVPQFLLSSDNLLPDMENAIYVNGVRIEKLSRIENHFGFGELAYAYNLNDRTLMNRDRSHVDLLQAFWKIQKLLFEQPYDIKKEICVRALKSSKKDIKKGPSVPPTMNFLEREKHKEGWQQAVAYAQGSEFEETVIASIIEDDNERAKRAGFSLSKFPDEWAEFLKEIGMEEAGDVVDEVEIERVNVRGKNSDFQETLVFRAYEYMKDFIFVRMEELPELVPVSKITVHGSEKEVQYDSKSEEIVVYYGGLNDPANVGLLATEIITALYGGDRYSIQEEYERILSDMIVWMMDN